LRDGRLEWIRADHLSAGDHVAVPRRIVTRPTSPPFYTFLPADTLVHLPGDKRHQRHQQVGELGERFTGLHPQIQGLSRGPGGFASSRLDRVPSHLTADVAYLCGLIASDGCFGPPGSRTIQ